MFLVNSRLGRFSAAHSHEHSFSRSYGVILQSSLAIVLSLTLGFSPHPCVSIFGTGPQSLSQELFLEAGFTFFCTCIAAFHPLHAFTLLEWPFHPSLLPRLPTLFHPRVRLAFSVTPFTPLRSTGFSACYPSTTPFGLALVPDFPRADEPSSGILGFSVRWILTIVPLLTPAFSLPAAPHVLPVMLLRHCNAPLPQILLSLASV